MATTIDITPTRAEHARICAYILCRNFDLAPSLFGDWYDYTTEQEDFIFKAYQVFIASKEDN
jgi:hypothetical protein